MNPGFAHGALTVHSGPGELSRVTRALRAAGRRIALVPTMGALHEGHRELIRRARRIPGVVVVVSIFVNPLQFAPGEDFERYPRPLEADLDVCRAEGVELVFTPGQADLYPDGAQVTVHPGRLGDQLEGAVRPGHFAGVLTVVAKLLHIVAPHFACFGEKDYQQLVLVTRMVCDLNFDTTVVGVPIVRAADGLALSSRNVYLSAEQRAVALGLSAALAAGAHASADGGASVLASATRALTASPDVQVEYLELRDVDLGPPPDRGDARLLVAARIGGIRLIDNASVLLGGAENHPDDHPDAGR